MTLRLFYYLKKLAYKIVLISGDSDFVPAAKLARMEGAHFILDAMGRKVKGQTLGWTREQVALAALHLQGGITQTRGRESDSGQEVAEIGRASCRERVSSPV